LSVFEKDLSVKERQELRQMSIFWHLPL